MIANNTFERIINKIKTQDSRGIKSLFSQTVQDTTSDLEENCVDLIQFMQGDIVSISDAADGGMRVDCKTEKGKIVKTIVSTFICETDLHKYYVAMKECTKDDFDQDNIGLLSIYIIKSEDWKEDCVYRGDGKWTPGIHIGKYKSDKWEIDRYKKTWRELLPKNERLVVNGATHVHWYDLYDR